MTGITTDGQGGVGITKMTRDDWMTGMTRDDQDDWNDCDE